VNLNVPDCWTEYHSWAWYVFAPRDSHFEHDAETAAIALRFSQEQATADSADEHHMAGFVTAAEMDELWDDWHPSM